MPTGLLIGPYARQIVGGRLKFWFAFEGRKGKIGRYEALIGKGYSEPVMRTRPKAFHAYALPDDLTAYPRATLVTGDTLATTALALLRGEDIADVTRMRFLGALPTRQAWQPIGDDPCTSRQPRLI